jgi:predicted kinase
VELIILIGLPGAGKSTFYRARWAETHRHISKDLMPRSATKERRQRELVSQALAEGASVVIDNQNAAAADRAWLIAEAHAHGARVVGYFFEATARECLLRNQGREGAARVPTPAIYAATKRLQPPAAAEGFDALFRVRTRGNNEEHGFDVEPMIVNAAPKGDS